VSHVTRVELVRDHCLCLSFDDGCEGEVQFGDDDWGGVFDPPQGSGLLR
jgi:hypothetical protein